MALLVFFPYTWSGGGGPPGNRYFMSVYPALFFLTPPLTSIAPAIFAWVGGALFTAKMLVNPFVAAKFPNQTTERGFARCLPVEITMANDLPVMLRQASRARACVQRRPAVLPRRARIYRQRSIDSAGHLGVWIAGDGRADILMRSEWPIRSPAVTAVSPIRTTFIVSAGGGEVRRSARCRARR